METCHPPAAGVILESTKATARWAYGLCRVVDPSTGSQQHPK